MAYGEWRSALGVYERKIFVENGVSSSGGGECKGGRRRESR